MMFVGEIEDDEPMIMLLEHERSCEVLIAGGEKEKVWSAGLHGRSI